MLLFAQVDYHLSPVIVDFGSLNARLYHWRKTLKWEGFDVIINCQRVCS